MDTPRQVVKRKERVLTAGIYIGILGSLFCENKEALIETELNKIKKFAQENGVTIVKTYIDREADSFQRYNFDNDYTAKKFQLKFMFLEY